MIGPCPVCGGEVPEQRAPGVFYRGRRVSVCSPACLLGFKREPERFSPAPAAAVSLAPEPIERRSPFTVRPAPPPDDA